MIQRVHAPGSVSNSVPSQILYWTIGRTQTWQHSAIIWRIYSFKSFVADIIGHMHHSHIMAFWCLEFWKKDSENSPELELISYEFSITSGIFLRMLPPYRPSCTHYIHHRFISCIEQNSQSATLLSKTKLQPVYAYLIRTKESELISDRT